MYNFYLIHKFKDFDSWSRAILNLDDVGTETDGGQVGSSSQVIELL